MKKIGILLLLITLVGCQSSPDSDVNPEVVQEEENVIERKEITQQLTNKELKQINMYLSNLSNGNFERYSQGDINHDALLWLGHWMFLVDYMNAGYRGIEHEYNEMDMCSYDIFEYEEFKNRLNYYFDFDIEKEGGERAKFQDDKFYIESLDAGYRDIYRVTQVERVFDNGDGSFLVEASIYKFEPSMTSYEVFEQYVHPKSTWVSTMKSDLIGTASATIVYSERLDHYVIDEYQTEYVSSEWSPVDTDDSSYDEIDYFDDEEVNDYGSDSLESTYTADEEYAINQINKLPEIQEYLDFGSRVFFETNDVVVDGMSGLQIAAYGIHESHSDHAVLINLYFMEYETRELYVMDIMSGEYVKVE